ncbi:MAG: LptF/LptG family permease [Nitrospinae bacterium]|nr:LptF/LptG family permease [Nitrospinota bacterium]
MRTLDRYIFKELAKIFFLAALVLLCVLLLEKVNFLSGLLLTKGASFGAIGMILLYLSPSFMVLAAPLACLMAALMVFSRLSAENEITAMKSSGMSMARILAPAAALSAVVFAATLYLSVNVVHEGNIRFAQVVRDVLGANVNLQLKERKFNESFNGLLIHITEKKDGYLYGVFISDQRRRDKPRIIEARKGRLAGSDEAQQAVMELSDGVIHSLDISGAYQTISFGQYTLRLDLSGEYAKPMEKEIPQLSIAELGERIDRLKSEGRGAYAELVALHKAFSAPVGCLILGVLGAPLGIMTHRRGSAGGFGMGVVMILVNYLLWMIGQGLGSEGKLPPVIAIWAPNIIMGGACVFLAMRVSKDGEPTMAERWISEAIHKLSRK